MISSKQLLSSVGIALVIGAGAYLMRLKKLSDQIQYRFKKVSRNKTAGSITVDMDLINPTNGEIEILSMDGEIRRGNSILATYKSKSPFTIRANSVTPLSLAFQIQGQSLLTSILNAALTKDVGTLDVTYRLKTALGVIPVKYNISPKGLI